MLGNQPREMRPGIDVNAPRTAQVLHQGSIHDAEVEAEFVPHLVAPLDLQGCWAHHENPSGPVAQDEFQHHHARFDRLAEAHIVGNQQVDPRHVHGPDHRVELVILDVDAGSGTGAWMFCTSAVEAAPQRTASRKASSRSGASKPVGAGRATCSLTQPRARSPR